MRIKKGVEMICLFFSLIVVPSHYGHCQNKHLVKGRFNVIDIIRLDDFVVIEATKHDNLFRILIPNSDTTEIIEGLRKRRKVHLVVKQLPIMDLGGIKKYYCDCRLSPPTVGHFYMVGNSGVVLPIYFVNTVYAIDKLIK